MWICWCKFCLLPASLRVAYLFLHADGLTEEAVNVFEVHAAVRHALHSTAETNRSIKTLTVTTVELCECYMWTDASSHLHAYSTV